MKKYLSLTILATALALASCGGADEAAKKMIDSLRTDSTNKANAQKIKDDSIKLSDSINSASKRMMEAAQADSVRKADSMAKAGKK